MSTPKKSKKPAAPGGADQPDASNKRPGADRRIQTHSDVEASAIMTTLEAFKPLNEGARQRVMLYVSQRFNLKLGTSYSGTQPETIPGTGDEGGEGYGSQQTHTLESERVPAGSIR